MKKALLIGINYTTDTSSNIVQLRGCIDDIVNLQTALIAKYGYESSNISVLRDDLSGCIPTKENITNQIKALIESNADEIWLHYSGHGSRILNQRIIKSASRYAEDLTYSGSMTDKDMNAAPEGRFQIFSGLKADTKDFDNILIPSDYKSAGYILDDELFSYIKSIRLGTSAIFTFDCCHSGTICDLPWSFEYRQRNTDGKLTDFIRSRIDPVEIENPNIFVISGSQDDQKSLDTFSYDFKQPMGAFTDALIKCINSGDIAIMLLYRNICEQLIRKGYKQTPVLSSSNPQPAYIILNR